jgi:hypothetical protein
LALFRSLPEKSPCPDGAAHRFVLEESDVDPEVVKQDCILDFLSDSNPDDLNEPYRGLARLIIGS